MPPNWIADITIESATSSKSIRYSDAPSICDHRNSGPSRLQNRIVIGPKQLRAGRGKIVKAGSGDGEITYKFAQVYDALGDKQSALRAPDLSEQQGSPVTNISPTTHC